MKLTIFTPTYNRRMQIKRLYKSLLRQTCYDFEWIVVDDGSTDDTDRYFAQLEKTEHPFPIIYKKKCNGGKCSAINVGVELARGDYFFIVDSDDFLIAEAVSIVVRKFEPVLKDHSFGAICFLRCFSDNRCVGGEVDYEQFDSDFLSYRNTFHYKGDRAEIIKTSIMREFPFPVYVGEKFLSESTVWNRIAKKYKCRYYNDKIYICEYQKGGLSDSSSKLFANSPKGSMLFYKEGYLDATTFKQKLICCLLFWRFSFSTNYQNYPELKPIISMYPYLLLYPVYLVARFLYKRRKYNLLDSLNSRK